MTCWRKEASSSPFSSLKNLPSLCPSLFLPFHFGEGVLTALSSSSITLEIPHVVNYTVPPKKIHQSLTPCWGWKWLYLGIGLCRFNQVKVRSYWSRLNPHPMTGVLRGKGKFGYWHTGRVECHVPKEPKIEVIGLHPKECQELLATTRNWQKARKESPASLRRGCGPDHTLITDSQPPELCKTTFLLLVTQPVVLGHSSLWSRVHCTPRQHFLLLATFRASWLSLLLYVAPYSCLPTSQDTTPTPTIKKLLL